MGNKRNHGRKKKRIPPYKRKKIDLGLEEDDHQPGNSCLVSQSSSSSQSAQPSITDTVETTDVTISASAKKLLAFNVALKRNTNNNSRTTTATSSSSKFSSFPNNNNSYFTASLKGLGNLLGSFICPECYSHNSMTVEPVPICKRGFYVKYNVVCSACPYNVSFETEPSAKPQPLNRLSVLACREAGITFGQMNRYYGVMGHCEPVTCKTFVAQSKILYQDAKTALASHLSFVSDIIRTKYSQLEERTISKEDVLDVAVTFDGTWQKRGRTSHHGVGVVIDIETGLVLDFEVLTNFCTACETQRDATDEWKRLHKESGKCEQNFVGTSGGMEAEAAVRIWKRSLELHNMRYTNMLSDGDSQAFLALKAADIYPVAKEECINHVSKRMYNGLVRLKNSNKGKEKIGGKGQLTEDLIRMFQTYYGNAIRRHVHSKGKLEDLQKSIMAILYHNISDDSNPSHHYCPVDINTWCKYNQLALGLIDDLPPQPKPKLPRAVGAVIEPLFVRLSDPSLLKRCRRAFTQNANECFNGQIWKRCPKIYWYGHQSIFTGTVLACLKFNQGAAGVFSLLQGMTSQQEAAAKKIDARRLRIRPDQRNKRRNSRRCKDVAYNPGGF